MIAPRLLLRAAIAATSLLTAFGGRTALRAQSLSVGEIAGRVVDAISAPIVAAEVQVIDRGSGTRYITSTGYDGSFVVRALPRGRYDLEVGALGFVPLVVLDVSVEMELPAALRLRSAQAPVTMVDTLRGASPTRQPIAWLVGSGLGDVPGTRRVVTDLAAGTTVGDDTGLEGLPWRYATVQVDGTPLRGFGSPAGDGADVAGLALPLRAIADATLSGSTFDAELGGNGVGFAAASARGGRTSQLRVGLEGGPRSYRLDASQAAARADGRAGVVVGAEAQRVERLAGEPNLADILRTDERVSGATRFDWQGDDGTLVTLRASASQVRSTGPAERSGLDVALGERFDATAGHASLSLYKRLTSRLAYEWRISADGEQVRAEDGSARVDLATEVTARGRAATLEADERRLTPRATAVLHGDVAAHRFKAGLVLASHELRSSYSRDTDGAFALGFRDAVSVQGAWRQVARPTVAGDFRVPEWALFAQDAVTVSDNLTLQLGLRVESFIIPDAALQANDAWRSVSGLDNRAVTRRAPSVSPRAAFTWRLDPDARWLLRGGVGVFRDLPDLRAIAEALTFDRAVDVRYGTGSFAADAEPTLGQAPVIGQTATLLGPDFDGPRSRRASLALEYRGMGWSAYAEATYRHTDLLARRQDLNRPQAAVGADQHGRPLYGTLVQEAATVVLRDASARRFPGFEAVYGLEATGVSEFAALTLGANRQLSQRASLAAEYSYSSTRDNLLSFAASRLAPFPDGLAGRDWADGRSDFDIPHRVLVAAEWRPFDRFQLAALYRGRSGAPYTPGLRSGVDANGDGDAQNDPAFVDVTLPGMVALVEDHECLRDAIGAFVGRNSCRDEWVHRVDLRVAATLARTRLGRIEAVVDALDVLPRSIAPRDRSLLLVDPTGTLGFNPVSGSASVPYVVNPAFGRSINDRRSTPLLRAGLRITP